MKHSQKIKIARAGMTRAEIKLRVPKFQTRFWEARKHQIAIRVAKRERLAKRKAEERRQRREQEATA